jgi:hypothetical protein
VEERAITDNNYVVEMLMQTIESIVNQITTLQIELDTKFTSDIDAKIKIATSAITNPPTNETPKHLRIIYELEKKK